MTMLIAGAALYAFTIFSALLWTPGSRFDFRSLGNAGEMEEGWRKDKRKGDDILQQLWDTGVVKRWERPRDYVRILESFVWEDAKTQLQCDWERFLDLVSFYRDSSKEWRQNLIRKICDYDSLECMHYGPPRLPLWKRALVWILS